ncbi:MAG: hypothetical protein R3C10_20355 [Pirellulales bacterium]
MNDSPTIEPAGQADDELLVAYLDGELDAATADAVERRLAGEPMLRERLQALTGTWDLLDHLPQETVDESFTQTTVAMVAMKADEGLERRAGRADWSLWLLGGVVLLAAAFCGFRWQRTLWPDANERLLRDWSVVERQALYGRVGDVDFVRSLRDRGLFTDADAAMKEGDDGR